ncbi:Esa1p-associated factor [Blastocladiella emersonii ATCC 22665]|nr:Esa1p-associated factor [Blastocladiella emersonii ATCC 22665]
MHDPHVGPSTEGGDRTAVYDVHERVLCYHGPFLYEAKVLKVRHDDGCDREYFIHYKGWNVKWDEWVTNGRMLKWQPANLTLMRQLVAESKQRKGTSSSASASSAAAAAATAGEPSGTPTTSSLGTAPTGATTPSAKDRSASYHQLQQQQQQQQHRDSDTGSGLGSTSAASRRDRDRPIALSKAARAAVRQAADEDKHQLIPIPMELKADLVDDWARISNAQLVPLPRTPSVADILERYRDERAKDLLAGSGDIDSKDKDKDKAKDTHAVDVLNETVAGLRAYFDRALGSLLLYRFERLQYLEILRAFPDRAASTLYGGEHLLRLFVEFPRVVATAGLDAEALDAVVAQVRDLVAWFEKHRKDLLVDQYDNAPPEYSNVAKAQFQ